MGSAQTNVDAQITAPVSGEGQTDPFADKVTGTSCMYSSMASEEFCCAQASPAAASAVTDSVDREAEATLAELRSTTQRSDQEVVHVSCSCSSLMHVVKSSNDSQEDRELLMSS